MSEDEKKVEEAAADDTETPAEEETVSFKRKAKTKANGSVQSPGGFAKFVDWLLGLE